MILIDKRDFLQSCALDTGLTQKQVNLVLDYFLDTAKKNLKEGKDVLIPGIGKITTMERKINKHMHPVTKEYHEGGIYKTIKIKPFPSFKQELNTYK